MFEKLLHSPRSPAPAPTAGIILGAVCGVVLIAAIVSAFAIRRRRLKKQDGQGLVRKWEAERQYGARMEGLGGGPGCGSCTSGWDWGLASQASLLLPASCVHRWPQHAPPTLRP